MNEEKTPKIPLREDIPLMRIELKECEFGEHELIVNNKPYKYVLVISKEDYEKLKKKGIPKEIENKIVVK